MLLSHMQIFCLMHSNKLVEYDPFFSPVQVFQHLLSYVTYLFGFIAVAISCSCTSTRSNTTDTGSKLWCECYSDHDCTASQG
jgi:hypothetical protein